MPKTKSTTKSSSKKSPLLTADPAEVGARVDEVLSLVARIEETLGPLAELSDTGRKYTTGRFRDGESGAIANILDTADSFPALFVALAAKDRGKDDAVFESGPTRDDLARRDHLARLAGALDPVAQGVSDTLLALGARVREITTPAYALARIAASVNPKVRVKLAPATKYYGAAAEKARQTKKAKKAAKPSASPA